MAWGLYSGKALHRNMVVRHRCVMPLPYRMSAWFVIHCVDALVSLQAKHSSRDMKNAVEDKADESKNIVSKAVDNVKEGVSDAAQGVKKNVNFAGEWVEDRVEEIEGKR